MATDKNVAEYYNANAELYNAHVNNAEESVYHSQYEKPAIRSQLPELNGLDVISIGCGSGVDAQWLKDNGANRVVGVDISEGLIDIAKREHPGIEFRVMDMEKLNFEDESFDLAYSSLALHYLDDWQITLKETRRILKPKGMYVFSCEHPIVGAMEDTQEGDVKYKRLGKFKDRSTGERGIYGDYLAKDNNGTARKDGIILGEGQIVTNYHRTFSKMVSNITESGFTIKKLIEPLPQEKMAELSPDDYSVLSKIPYFLIWVLEK